MSYTWCFFTTTVFEHPPRPYGPPWRVGGLAVGGGGFRQINPPISTSLICTVASASHPGLKLGSLRLTLFESGTSRALGTLFSCPYAVGLWGTFRVDIYRAAKQRGAGLSLRNEIFPYFSR